MPAESTPPLTDDDIVWWLALLRDSELTADEPDAEARLVDTEDVPSPDDFAEWCAAESRASAATRAHQDRDSHEVLAQVRNLPPTQRSQLQHTMRALADEAHTLEQRDEAWMSEAVFDVRAGRGSVWQDRADHVRGLIRYTQPRVNIVGPLTSVEITGGETAVLRSMAEQVRSHLARGGTLKMLPDGRPKTGVFTTKTVKNAEPLFMHVRVNGLPPTTDKQLVAFLAFVDAQSALERLDRAWPADLEIPEEDTLAERLQWHVTELTQLDRVLALGQSLTNAAERLTAAGVTPPTWTDLETVREYATLVDAAAALDQLEEASSPLRRLEDLLAHETQWYEAGACLANLERATQARDHEAYATAYARLTRLHRVRYLVHERDRLGARIGDAAPALRDAVLADPQHGDWDGWLASFEAAWHWAGLASWILGQQTTDVNALQTQIAILEDRLRSRVTELAALRAWDHALAPDRLTGRAKADLVQYAQLVRRLGKGTGKYAAQWRGEIRRAMERCRASVPVWIMPTYRIAEQFQVEENMFDVVLVDEASQAGVDAAFLQYLAPTIVVIGDDKQVSPAAVGVDQQQVRDLAAQYLPGDRYRASWQDPTRSLFDEARMRYGGQITLVEHRRCVPEIIGFSNRIAYEPDGVRLVPVRQYGADRLDPVRPVRVPEGYTRGTTAKINPAEIDAVVDQIEKCLADPRYDGRTMGVISLQGTAQARSIERELLDRIPPEEWNARQLRCGDASAFQGSERDVMFLSMVAAHEPGKRLPALTGEQYVQRYNVAVSRAKDQLWIFHSVEPALLTNSEDMRFQLLEYCYGVTSRLEHEDDRFRDTVPEDVLVERFDSLFEQRVFNRIQDRGYTIIPQYESQGYYIDLVIVGATGSLAVECDGDHWHGADAYERDLGRQRDLERCGWQFFRIRESAFYLDQSAVLAGLWQKLDELEIRPPSGHVGATNDVQSPMTEEKSIATDTAAAEPPPGVEPATGKVSLWPILEHPQAGEDASASEQGSFPPWGRRRFPLYPCIGRARTIPPTEQPAQPLCRVHWRRSPPRSRLSTRTDRRHRQGHSGRGTDPRRATAGRLHQGIRRATRQ